MSRASSSGPVFSGRRSTWPLLIKETGDLLADIQRLIDYSGPDGQVVILEATGAVYRYSPTPGRVVRPGSYAWASPTLLGGLDGVTALGSETPAWTPNATGSGKVLENDQGRFTLDSFVASTSSHTLVVDGTSYNRTAGLTEEATMDSFKTDVELGEPGVTMTRIGTGALTRLHAQAATTLAATLNATLTGYDGEAWLACDASTVAGDLANVTLPTLGGGIEDMYMAGWFWWHELNSSSLQLYNGQNFALMLANGGNWELSGGSRAEDVSATADKVYLEVLIQEGVAAGDGGAQAWVNGRPSPLSVDHSLNASALKQVILFDAQGASTNEGRCRDVIIVGGSL